MKGQSVQRSGAPPTAGASPLHAFEACGIELEYALVRRESLDVSPVADRALQELDGAAEPVASVTRGMFGWSNELVLHVLELKNEDPTVPMDLLAARFQYELRQMNAALRALGVCLMPTGMHPWMEPAAEAKLWPHEHAEIYRRYDRIFGCRTHGYANLQSMHVNLPFADETEFVRLHEAIRLVLPILPALAASSPYAEGRRAAALDYRMQVYRDNALRVPEVTAEIVPQSCSSRDDYRRGILAPLYHAIARHDPDGLLQHEWLNARGAIARFDRHAIEIRILDTQECPRMDVAIAALVIDTLQALYDGRLGNPTRGSFATNLLAGILADCVLHAEAAEIDREAYLRAFGVSRSRVRAGELWTEIGAQLAALGALRRALWQGALDHITLRGTLARRLVCTLGAAPTRAKLRSVYSELCEALEAGALFR